MALGGIYGRDDELATLYRFLQSEPGPAALVISGDPGIGKTALWRDGLSTARKAGYQVLTSSPAQAEATLSFVGLGDLLQASITELLVGLPAPQRRALEIALLMVEADEPPLERRAIAIAFLNALRLLARRHPVLLAIDDVQWLDRATAEVLAFAMRRLNDEPVRLLLGVRSSDQAPDPLGLLETHFWQRVSHLRLGPLSLGALHRLLQERQGLVLPRPAMRRLHELSAGNPLLAMEIARLLGRDAGTAAVRNVGISSLPKLVRLRIEALPPETLHAVQAAAAMSHPTPAVLSSIGIVSESLDTAVRAEVLEIDEGRVRFTHPMFAAGAYAMLDGESRCALHRRLADIATDPEEQAHHLAVATPGPDGQVASALEAVATRARSRGAVAAAAEMAEEAVRLTPPNDAEAGRRRTLAAARYWFESGDTGAARRLLEILISATPMGADRAAALTGLARIHLFSGNQQLATDLFQEACMLPALDPGTQSDAEMGLATSLLFRRMDLRAALHHAEVAAHLAEQAGDARRTANALTSQGLVASALGRPNARALIDRAMALEPADHWQVIQEPAFGLAVYLLWTDSLAEARVRLLWSRNRAEERGDESSLALILAHLSIVEWLSGDWRQALRVAEEGEQIAAETGQEPDRALALGARCLVEVQCGLIAEATEHGSMAIESAGGRWLPKMAASWALGQLELSRGNAAGAHRHLQQLADDSEMEEIAEPGSVPFIADDVEALIGLGRLDAAEKRLLSFESNARRLGRASSLARSARCHGLLAAARGDLDSAIKAFRQALTEHGRVSIPLERCRTLLALGISQRRAKQRAAARETLDAARIGFEQLGAAQWAERARMELGRVAGRRSSGDRLTPTEQRVAQLVSEGHPNKAVARLLFVTERTVEANLSRIYAKLGIRSRTELARRFANKRIEE